MVQTPAEYLDGVTAVFFRAFPPITVKRDERQGRHLLEMWGHWGSFRVRLLEVIGVGIPRKYAYYVLDGERVIVGFDNAPDPGALRLKYGRDFVGHRHERVPHQHEVGKTVLQLTDEMNCVSFVEWVRDNLQVSSG